MIIPKIKKDINKYLKDEEGSINKNTLIKAGLIFSFSSINFVKDVFGASKSSQESWIDGGKASGKDFNQYADYNLDTKNKYALCTTDTVENIPPLYSHTNWGHGSTTETRTATTRLKCYEHSDSVKPILTSSKITSHHANSLPSSPTAFEDITIDHTAHASK